MGGGAAAANSLSEDERRRLVEGNLDFVRALALDVVRHLRDTVSVEDLAGYGAKGLIEAAQRFDPTHGTSFTTFAYYRVHGAILDGVRELLIGRREWVELRFQARANELLARVAEQVALGRDAAPPQPSLEQRLAGLDEVFADLSMAFVATWDAAAEEPEHADPSHPFERRRVRCAIERLPEREREVVRLHYGEDRTLDEVGRILGMSRSWASRLHLHALRLLRAELTGEARTRRSPGSRPPR